MADRQIFQLGARTPALTDVIGTQDAAGVAEQGKSTLQQIKTAIIAGLPITTAKRVVLRFSCISSVFSGQAVMESDFPGLAFVSINITAIDEITIRLSANIFNDATKINFQLNTNGTLFLRPIITASDTFKLSVAEHDGTPPSSMYDFNSFFITIYFYP